MKSRDMIPFLSISIPFFFPVFIVYRIENQIDITIAMDGIETKIICDGLWQRFPQVGLGSK